MEIIVMATVTISGMIEHVIVIRDGKGYVVIRRNKDK